MALEHSLYRTFLAQRELMHHISMHIVHKHCACPKWVDKSGIMVEAILLHNEDESFFRYPSSLHYSSFVGIPL